MTLLLTLHPYRVSNHLQTVHPEADMKKNNFKLEVISVKSFITSINSKGIRGGKSEVDPTSQSKPTTTPPPPDSGDPLVCYKSLLENCNGPIP